MFKCNFRRVIRASSVLSFFFVGCSSTLDSGLEWQSDDAKSALISVLGGKQTFATYSAAEVHAASGLWNVYVVNNPPDEIIIRQSRPNSEIEFGLTADSIWRNDLGAGAVPLTSDWRWFIRNHEIVHLANRISRWKFLRFGSVLKDIGNSTRGQVQYYEDEFGLPVQIHLGEDQLPTKIILTKPQGYGDGNVEYTIHDWLDFQGQKKMVEFDMVADGSKMTWIYRGFELIDEQNSFKITAPQGIHPQTNAN